MPMWSLCLVWAAYGCFISIPPLMLACSGKEGMVDRNQGKKEGKMTFPDKEFWRKGGVGLIVEDVYVDLNSKRNKLILADRQVWEGLPAVKVEVVIVENGKAYLTSELPPGFKISDSIVISFQVGRVYFYDFKTMDGGFYSR